jgi:XTP/dITP diphosphohydrolase
MRAQTLLVATGNAHKVREIGEMLAGTMFEVRGSAGLEGFHMPDETGASFTANAQLKARVLRDFLGGARPFILADDSGLECEDLDGAPGIFSARYASAGATDVQNNVKLVTALRALPRAKMAARYVCALCLIFPDGREELVEETCEGRIVFAPRGKGGFGYDPHFFVPECGKTMAELPPALKNEISHRGKALRRVVALLA